MIAGRVAKSQPSRPAHNLRRKAAIKTVLPRPYGRFPETIIVEFYSNLAPKVRINRSGMLPFPSTFPRFIR